MKLTNQETNEVAGNIRELLEVIDEQRTMGRLHEEEFEQLTRFLRILMYKLRVGSLDKILKEYFDFSPVPNSTSGALPFRSGTAKIVFRGRWDVIEIGKQRQPGQPNAPTDGEG